jgi:elongation factor P
MQYLYDSGEAAVFMDSQDYEQDRDTRRRRRRGDEWVLPNDEVDVLFVDEQPTTSRSPSAIEMKVTETQPGSRATRLGGGNKPRRWSPACRPGPPLHREGEERSAVDTAQAASTSRAA